MPFARVVGEFTHENQTVTQAVAQKLSRRDSQSDPTVRGITLDTNFRHIDPAQ